MNAASNGAASVRPGWTETACRFADDKRLAGVICQPAASLSSAGSAVGPIIVFVSAGLLHDVGPYSLYVEMARRYASQGFTSLRFDLGGIGNSRADTSTSADDAHVKDVIAAMNFLESRHDCREFILCGLCSGAENAHRAAVQDSRVTGLLMLEGYIFPTPAYYLWHYLPRIVSLRRWSNFIANRLRSLRARTDFGNANDSQPGGLWTGSHSSQQQVASELQLLCERGVLQLQIFAGGTGDCSYAGQFRDAFRQVELSDNVAVRFFPNADHMYILRSDRNALFETVDQWLELYCSRMAVNPATEKVDDSRRAMPPRPQHAARTGPAGIPAAKPPPAPPVGFNNRVNNDARTSKWNP